VGIASLNDLSKLLVCPRSGTGLTYQGHGFVASDGASTYPIDEGIIDLRCNRRDYYFNPVRRDAMSALTQQARHVPWSSTIRRFMEHVKHNPDWLDNLVADGRYAWKLLLDLQPGSQVLDLGCGLGNLTKNLAPHVGRVFAMDLTIERLRFAAERFARFNRGDDIVLLAAGDGSYLPFRDQSLDLVVLSGVLEWVAEDGPHSAPGDGKIAKAVRMSLSILGARNPRRIQRRFLQEIRRVLKPTGQLFIAIENRLNLEYFYRRVDHHSSLRFGSLLPRFAANLYSIVAAHRPYRTYTYSLSGYRKLLTSAGFDSHEFFGLSPGYSNLREIRPLTAAEQIWSPVQPESLWQRIARNKRFVPAFGIIASASPERRTSLLARLISHIENQIDASGPLRVRTLRLTDEDQGVLDVQATAQSYRLHTPFGLPAVARMKRQHEVLMRLRQRADIRHLLPSIPLHGSFQGQDYFLESRLPGRALAELLRSAGREAYLEQVVALMETIGQHDAVVASSRLSGELYRTEVDEPLRRIAQVLDSPEAVIPLADVLRRTLYGKPVGRGIVHGNFTLSNVLIDNGKVSGLLDWRSSRMVGLPVLDFLDYLHSVQAHCFPHHSDLEHLELLATGRWPSKKEWDELQARYRAFGIDRLQHRSFVYLCWMHRVSRQLQTYMVYDPKALDARLVQVLKHVARLAPDEHRAGQSIQCA
jgi:ubiquinone/menaquinone biosynthesis C-methylase UbiE/aminoglycoside phosphotransferase (APT) family kinase protein